MYNVGVNFPVKSPFKFIDMFIQEHDNTPIIYPNFKANSTCHQKYLNINKVMINHMSLKGCDITSVNYDIMSNKNSTQCYIAKTAYDYIRIKTNITETMSCLYPVHQNWLLPPAAFAMLTMWKEGKSQLLVIIFRG